VGSIAQGEDFDEPSLLCKWSIVTDDGRADNKRWTLLEGFASGQTQAFLSFSLPFVSMKCLGGRDAEGRAMRLVISPRSTLQHYSATRMAQVSLRGLEPRQSREEQPGRIWLLLYPFKPWDIRAQGLHMATEASELVGVCQRVLSRSLPPPVEQHKSHDHAWQERIRS